MPPALSDVLNETIALCSACSGFESCLWLGFDELKLFLQENCGTVA